MAPTVGEIVLISNAVIFFRLAEARKDALASVDLMTARYSRIVTDETSRNGLVILIALYGRILSGSASFALMTSTFLIHNINQSFLFKFCLNILDISQLFMQKAVQHSALNFPVTW
jgi:hypothetical protein